MDFTPSIKPTNHTDPTESIAARAAELGADAVSAVTNTVNRAGNRIQKVADQGEQFAKKSPWLAAGVVLGVGAVIGALALRFMGSPAPVAKSSRRD